MVWGPVPVPKKTGPGPGPNKKRDRDRDQTLGPKMIGTGTGTNHRDQKLPGPGPGLVPVPEPVPVPRRSLPAQELEKASCLFFCYKFDDMHGKSKKLHHGCAGMVSVLKDVQCTLFVKRDSLLR